MTDANNEAAHKPEIRNVDGKLLSNVSLEALQGTEQRKIMDIVDKLRRTGLSTVLELPQIVVCGDQSSGKSSVLEAITEIPFPRKENLCTRFATEIVLRRDHASTISTKITPDKSRLQSEQKSLREFSRKIEDFSELPGLIEEATELMGLNATDIGAPRAFSRDVLSIEITGPSRPQLTLVDLPGLIHAESKSQSTRDVELIHSLVEEYISNPRTIILAVVSAKNDYANQAITNKAKKADPDYNRTMGIITKPDFLRAGSENELNWIDLAQNKESFEKRNAAEADFFSKGSYNELDRNIVGIASLRTRLSRTLSDHLKTELPGLKKELEKKLEETFAEQKQYLITLGLATHDIFKSAVQGHYEGTFFGGITRDQSIDTGDNIKRLRAVVQHLNLQFAERMRLTGGKYVITNQNGCIIDNEELDDEDENDSSGLSHIEAPMDVVSHVPKKITKEEAVNWVVDILRRTRGRELPGNFNPMLISELFWEQSSPWETMAMEHINNVADACQEFVCKVLQKVTSNDIEARLQDVRVESALKEALKEARAELKKVIADKQRHPITYNHYYTMTIQKMRRAKRDNALKKLTDQSRRSVREHNTGAYVSMVDVTTLQGKIDNQVELDMDKFSAEEALDAMLAYYKSERKYFTDVITKQVIERHLVDTLPENVLSPIIIAQMTDDEISYIAAEPADVTQKRTFLEARKKMLEDGQDTFRRATGGLRVKK
ncbi:hypothetical protein NA57DRAFT_66664 [Rhizodiscina lignyota]|uniref:Uncharacterized protein n=1 Tax=Rhizodiscina lignyota TaxID=1504668 RepID=A0A9P4M8G5_9PEZI|nr:hypothetical protein NA57DRAFT_66664 [Rhizodiscina lignyota]